MDEKIYTADMLKDFINHADVILFGLVYPNGLTIDQMKASGHGWLIRIAERILRKERIE